jgi:hypothetical protein
LPSGIIVYLICQRVPAGELDAKMEDAATEDQPTVGMAEGEPSVRIKDRVLLSHAEYELLQAELEKIYKRQEDLRRRWERHYRKS